MRRPYGLRARLVAGFVGIAVLTTLVAALFTSLGLHRSIDGYLERRTEDAAADAADLAGVAYAQAGRRWTRAGLDLLSHELVLTGYDFRLRSRAGPLLDTTNLDDSRGGYRRVAERPVFSRGEQVATLEMYALGPRGNMPADDELRAQLDTAHLLAAALAALVAILVGLVVASRLSRPLRLLAGAARELAGSERMPDAVPRGSSEVRELGDALDALAADLAAQRRVRRQLAQDLSHELRTPLMLLQSRIEAMQDGVVPFSQEELSTLHTETLRLGRLIGQIERLAEAEAHARPLAIAEVALDEVAREAHAAIALPFDLRGLRVEVDLAPVRALADADAVGQIVTNLLTNALKYAPPEAPVHLCTRAEGAWAVLRVEDGGSGVGAGPDGDLFARRYRAPRAAERNPGAGLGLAIARELAELQGGRLELESGRPGTSFALALPGLPRTIGDGPAPRSAPASSPKPLLGKR